MRPSRLLHPAPRRGARRPRRASADDRAERARVEQLAALGRLAAQLAHDLKNPLAALKGAAQFLQGEQARRGAPPDEQDFVAFMLRDIERMSRSVDAYQRVGQVTPRPAPTDLNALVRELTSLQGFAGGPGTSVDLALDPSIPCALVDADLLGRVLQNLLRNAFEAMPSGGAAVVRTAPAPRGRVAVAVEDSGVGMTERERRRALDSFFTTKAHGSGLGLAYARRVVEAHGGALHVASAPRRGTSVTIELPAAVGREAAA